MNKKPFISLVSVLQLNFLGTFGRNPGSLWGDIVLTQEEMAELERRSSYLAVGSRMMLCRIKIRETKEEVWEPSYFMAGIALLLPVGPPLHNKGCLLTEEQGSRLKGGMVLTDSLYNLSRRPHAQHVFSHQSQSDARNTSAYFAVRHGVSFSKINGKRPPRRTRDFRTSSTGVV